MTIEITTQTMTVTKKKKKRKKKDKYFPLAVLMVSIMSSFALYIIYNAVYALVIYDSIPSNSKPFTFLN